MNLPFGPLVMGGLAASIPFVFLTAAVFRRRNNPFAAVGAAVVLVAALAVAVAAGIALGVPVDDGKAAAFVRLDAVTACMLTLVAFIAWVIVRYSRSYLAGDPRQVRYARWLAATLSAVSALVISNHLWGLALAWMATSLCLHQLLTFYADRPQALVAAHKKFLASRVADLCLFSGIALLVAAGLPLNLDELAVAVGAGPLPASAQAAAVLFAVAAALKCAQLPFHGWLTQVMEAPTPVSALLHAGIVNIGGLLLIRLAPLMVLANGAQTLLVVVGSVTAVVAALVMTTRVSVKVALAWSTCAQMGFMLLQCGLGAYQLALLHILAHSLYKAHAFLSSGSVVEVWQASKLAPRRHPVGLWGWFGAAAAALALVGAVAWAFGVSFTHEPALLAFAFILGLALAPILVRARGAGAWAAAVAVPALYFTWHAVFASIIAVPAAGSGITLRVGIAMVSFAALFIAQAVMQAHPRGRLARTLYPRLFAGLYLDELFTRVTFRIWPPRLPPKTNDACKLFLVHTSKA